jgi:hypothetical protein
MFTISPERSSDAAGNRAIERTTWLGHTASEHVGAPTKHGALLTGQNALTPGPLRPGEATPLIVHV